METIDTISIKVIEFGRNVTKKVDIDGEQVDNLITNDLGIEYDPNNHKVYWNSAYMFSDNNDEFDKGKAQEKFLKDLHII